MAEETLDRAIDVCQLKPVRKCQTKGLLLDGAHNWSQNMHIRLVQDFGLDVKVSLMQMAGIQQFSSILT